MIRLESYNGQWRFVGELILSKPLIRPRVAEALAEEQRPGSGACAELAEVWRSREITQFIPSPVEVNLFKGEGKINSRMCMENLSPARSTFGFVLCGC